MSVTRRLVITSLVALVVAGGGVAIGQAADDETVPPASAPASAAPAPASAPPSLEDCKHLAGSAPLPEASGGKQDPEEIVYLGECNYGEPTVTP